MQLGDKKLIVQRASVGAAKLMGGEGGDIAALLASIPNVPMPINIPGLQVSIVAGYQCSCLSCVVFASEGPLRSLWCSTQSGS